MKKKNLFTILGIIIVVIIVLILILIPTYNSKNKTITNNVEPLKIGFVGPLTTDAATWGIAAKQGIDLAKNDFNVDVVYEDSACDSKTAVNAVNKLINIDNVNYVTGPSCSGALLSIAPIFNKNNKLLIGTGTSSPLVTNAGDNIFRVWPSDSLQIAKMLSYLYHNRQDIKSIAVLYLNNDYGESMANYFENNYRDYGLKLSYVGKFERDTKDVKTQLTKINDLNVDAIYIFSYVNEFITITEEIKKLNMKTQIITLGWLVNDPKLSTAEKRANFEGALFGVTDESVSPEFMSRLKSTYGDKIQYPWISALAYDTVSILKNAYKNCDENVTCAKNYLYSMPEYKGVSGKIKFDPNGDPIGVNFIIKQVKNGVFVDVN